MSVQDNKFLIVKPSVRLTRHIIPVIIGLDAYFEKANLKATVTSGQRTSGDQLAVIRQYAVRHNVHTEFPEVLTCIAEEKNPDGTYMWQRAWSRLLNLGIIINPPYPAVAMFDYWRGTVNRKGAIIGHSPHFAGLAFDIGGGIDHDISNEIPIVAKALAAHLPGLKGYLPERKNNCVHCDVFPVK